MRIAGRDLRADKNDSLHLAGQREVLLFQQFLGTGQFAGRSAGEQVIQGQHGVRLAATEVGLQFDNRIAPFAMQSLDGLRQQALQAFGEECPAEEFRRVLVFV